MKNYFASFLLLLSAAVGLSSCRESSKLPEPKNESVPLIIPEINPNKSYFDFRRSQMSEKLRTDSFSLKPAYYTRPEFEFVVNPSKGYAELQTVEVYKSFRRNGTFGPRVRYTNLTSFPATITINSQDALRGLKPNSATTTPPILNTNISANNRINKNILVPEAVVFTFEYILKDGRRIVLTPISADSVLLNSSLINRPLAAIAEFK